MQNIFWNQNGIAIFKRCIPPEILMECRTEILEYMNQNPILADRGSGGYTIVDFVGNNVLKRTAELRCNPGICKALEGIFGGCDYRFCVHNDIGVNRAVSWHKDKLNGKYAEYEKVPIWDILEDGTKHEIVKVLIYLQPHSKGNDGLQVIPGSHLNPNIENGNVLPLETDFGDVVIFDQRITHRGALHQKTSLEVPRILVSFGFGKNNIFTDQFEKGTIARQNEQNSYLRYSS